MAGVEHRLGRFSRRSKINPQNMPPPGIELRKRRSQNALKIISQNTHCQGSNQGTHGQLSAPKINWNKRNTHAEGSNPGHAGYKARLAKRRRFVETLGHNYRRWRTAETAVFSGQPGGAPPSNFAESHEIYINRKISQRGSRIHKHLSLNHHAFSGSKEISFMHQT